MSETRKSFGALLRQLRSAAGLSQEELAERAGLSRRGVSDLERGLSQAPRLETVRLLAHGLALADDERALLLAAARPARASESLAARGRRPSRSLPVPLTRLIGRETELAALRTALQNQEARWVTLTGPGGVGKTRLAVAVAAGLQETFPDGIVFVDLSPLTDPHLVGLTIATTLGVRQSPEQTLLEALVTFIGSKRLLLILDNCERLLAVAPDIAALLEACPGLIIFATSREPFHVRGERQVPLRPLPMPAGDQLLPLDELAQAPAVTLFVERAKASHPGFVLTGANAPAVTAICQRLDGLPLAIELAAARIKMLPPAALLGRLERRLPMLTGGGRDLPSRQRTMRDAIAWSYGLLTTQEQALFRYLSVFAGGFTLEAAENVAGGDRRAASTELVSAASTTLDLVGALLEKSLVESMMAPAEGATNDKRFRMLETVREYGLEQLALAGEMEDARERHATYFLRHDANVTQHFSMLDIEILTRLAPERDNLYLALDWFEERGDAEALLQLSAMGFGLWFRPGLYLEGLRWFEQALTRSHNNASAARVPMLDGAATLAIFQGAYARAAEFIAHELQLARQLGDPLLISRALTVAGLLDYRRGAYRQAEDQVEEACRILYQHVDVVPEPELRLGTALLELGDIALAQSQFDQAARHYGEVLARAPLERNLWVAIDAQIGLAAVSLCTGNTEEAARLYQDSLDRAWDVGATVLMASALLGLAAVASTSGLPEEGAYLLGAAEGIGALLSAPLFPRDQPVRDQCLAALTAAVGPERLVAAREEGRSLSLEAATVIGAAVVATAISSP